MISPQYLRYSPIVLMISSHDTEQPHNTKILYRVIIAVFKACFYYMFHQLIISIAAFFIKSALTHSPPQPPIGGVCFDQVSDHDILQYLRYSPIVLMISSHGTEQPHNTKILYRVIIAVFKACFYYMFHQLIISIASFFIKSALTHSPPQPPIGGVCFDQVSDHDILQYLRYSPIVLMISSHGIEQPHNTKILYRVIIAVFKACFYYMFHQLIIFIAAFFIKSALTPSPPQPPISRFCFESLIARTAN